MSLLDIQLEARNLLQLRPVFLHCKTTGAAEISEVVEIAILDSAGTPLVDELVKPKRHIRQTASDEHGITDEMITFAPRWAEILPKVEEILVGKRVCVYDLADELQALKNSHLNNHNRWVFDDDKFFSLRTCFRDIRMSVIPPVEAWLPIPWRKLPARWGSISKSLHTVGHVKMPGFCVLFYWRLLVGKFIIDVSKSTRNTIFHQGDGLCRLCPKP